MACSTLEAKGGLHYRYTVHTLPKIEPTLEQHCSHCSLGGRVDDNQLSPNQRMKPTLLSKVFVRVFSVVKRTESSFVALRQPQGG